MYHPSNSRTTINDPPYAPVRSDPMRPNGPRIGAVVGLHRNNLHCHSQGMGDHPKSLPVMYQLSCDNHLGRKTSSPERQNYGDQHAHRSRSYSSSRASQTQTEELSNLSHKSYRLPSGSHLVRNASDSNSLFRIPPDSNHQPSDTLEVDPDRSASMSRTRQQCFKTKMCHFYLQQKCSRGARCVFAHSPEELRSTPDLSKTKICIKWKKGLCFVDSSKCSYAHGVEELRPCVGLCSPEGQDMDRAHADKSEVTNISAHPTHLGPNESHNVVANHVKNIEMDGTTRLGFLQQQPIDQSNPGSSCLAGIQSGKLRLEIPASHCLQNAPSFRKSNKNGNVQSTTSADIYRPLLYSALSSSVQGCTEQNSVVNSALEVSSELQQLRGLRSRENSAMPFMTEMSPSIEAQTPEPTPFSNKREKEEFTPEANPNNFIRLSPGQHVTPKISMEKGSEELGLSNDCAFGIYYQNERSNPGACNRITSTGHILIDPNRSCSMYQQSLSEHPPINSEHQRTYQVQNVSPPTISPTRLSTAIPATAISCKGTPAFKSHNVPQSVRRFLPISAVPINATPGLGYLPIQATQLTSLATSPLAPQTSNEGSTLTIRAAVQATPLSPTQVSHLSGPMMMPIASPTAPQPGSPAHYVLHNGYLMPLIYAQPSPPNINRQTSHQRNINPHYALTMARPKTSSASISMA